MKLPKIRRDKTPRARAQGRFQQTALCADDHILDPQKAADHGKSALADPFQIGGIGVVDCLIDQCRRWRGHGAALAHQRAHQQRLAVAGRAVLQCSQHQLAQLAVGSGDEDDFWLRCHAVASLGTGGQRGSMVITVLPGSLRAKVWA